MKIALDDIKAAPKELAYSEEVDELNARLDRGAHDYRVPRGLEVRVEFYRSGLDVFFNGALHGQVSGTGALALGDAVTGVRERGRLMQAAVPPGEGAMAAVVGLEAEAVAALCAEAAQGDVLVPANLNGGGQVVVAGHARAVERLL